MGVATTVTPAPRLSSLSARALSTYIDDAALTADGRVDVLEMRPIARLGYKDYTSVESVFHMEKRTPEDYVAPRQAQERGATFSSAGPAAAVTVPQRR